MSVYFDASLLVSLFVEDDLSDRANAYVAKHRPTPAISDFATAEVASAINRRVRVGGMSRAKAHAVLADFDSWRAGRASACFVQSSDIIGAEVYLRRLDLSLRTPDAVNIAIAARLGLELATFDDQMKSAASILGIRLAPT